MSDSNEEESAGKIGAQQSQRVEPSRMETEEEEKKVERQSKERTKEEKEDGKRQKMKKKKKDGEDKKLERGKGKRRPRKKKKKKKTGPCGKPLRHCRCRGVRSRYSRDDSKPRRKGPARRPPGRVQKRSKDIFITFPPGLVKEITSFCRRRRKLKTLSIERSRKLPLKGTESSQDDGVERKFTRRQGRSKIKREPEAVEAAYRQWLHWRESDL